MRPARITGGLVAISLLASACSSSASDPSSASSTTAVDQDETTTSATFRDEPLLDSRLTQEFVDSTLEEQIADFLESPNSGKSAFIAESMGDSGDVSWAPWLLDLHRLGQSTATDDKVIAALEKMSGTSSRRKPNRRFPELRAVVAKPESDSW